MPVDGGMVNGCSDLQGRFNLNNFGVSYKTPEALNSELSGDESGYAKVWNSLLLYFEIPIFPGRVEAIVDWLDDDSSKGIGPEGAEEEDYAGQIPPQMIADSVMVEPSELASVVGYEIFEMQRLMPWITAACRASTPSSVEETTRINVNTIRRNCYWRWAEI